MQKRKLAFHKKDKTPWKVFEFYMILQYTGDSNNHRSLAQQGLYIYDDHDTQQFMNSWYRQDVTDNTFVYFEYVFPIKQRLQISEDKLC
ncbi:MAG: hypothetical protein KAI79_02345 [Bacteroidales bacterium]|nr:hypothetical protein [Bacteroidales bacterium]